MYEKDDAFFFFCDNTDMAYGLTLAISTCEEDQITGHGIFKADEFTFECNCAGGIWNSGAEIFQYKVYKSAAIKAFWWFTAIAVWFFEVFASEVDDRITQLWVIMKSRRCFMKNGNFLRLC